MNVFDRLILIRERVAVRERRPLRIPQTPRQRIESHRAADRRYLLTIMADAERHRRYREKRRLVEAAYKRRKTVADRARDNEVRRRRRRRRMEENAERELALRAKENERRRKSWQARKALDPAAHAAALARMNARRQARKRGRIGT